MNDRKIYVLTALAIILALGHHVDHAIRGNHVGWPLMEDVNAFTASLAIYPIVAVAISLYYLHRVGPGSMAIVSGGGALFLGAVHFGPWAIEPPTDIIDAHASPIVGWFALGWLLALLLVLSITCLHEVKEWSSRDKAARARD
jgi:hypothetical protein